MSNEKKEFEILFRDIYPKLYYAAQQIVKDDEMCRDFISDSFLQLWSRRTEVEPSKRAAFLYRIVHNKCIDYIRKESAKKKYIEFYSMLYGTSAEEIEGSWEESERRILAMYRNIETLTPQTQKILKLCYFQNKKYREAAEELGISISAVRKHIVQALKVLRAALPHE
jgi:RNA polymerase sigma-70 factor (family 1)